MEFDLHGLELWEALEEIVYKLEECQTKDIREITLIHGFHRGQVLKKLYPIGRIFKRNGTRRISIENEGKLKYWCILLSNSLRVKLKLFNK